MIKGFTFFSKNTGLEIREVERVLNKVKEGKVRLRFFTTDGTRKNLMFLLNSDEAFILSRGIERIVREGGNFSLFHTYFQNGQEIMTKLIVERWEREGKRGYAFVIVRGDEKINLPLEEGRFLFASELLKALSISSSWWEMREISDSEVVNAGYQGEESQESSAGSQEEGLGSSQDLGEDSEEESDEGGFEAERMEGEVQAVARSGRAFKVNDSWINFKDGTITQGNIERGKKVEVLISKSEGRLYAEKVKVL